ncbi:RNA methyltransferase [Aquabacterium sp. J223]|uniref:RNA methyltransferase n=1 Tax=Aquabacterium sp. J223 TaxID=2898431 RepID=UPI0021ADE419|nr:RNA methyltransferase [Aquabacterium sp. J223]UUX95607.1 RNA methyltransferase [Aquabacterium sp. J223]
MNAPLPDPATLDPALRSLSAVRERLAAAGARPAHADAVLRRWLGAVTKRRDEHWLPAGVRAGLPALLQGLDGLARVRDEHPAADGSSRLLVALADGQTVESVLLPRDGVCVSSQVGCAVGCTFCMTGRGGLLRQLGSAEIAAQVVLARRRRPLRKVVFMGMGEPSHNLDAVMEAIELLGTVGGIGHKQLVFSTVGDERAFRRLPQGPVKPALALSLHSVHAERRAALLPQAPRWAPAELLGTALGYAESTGHPLQVQWTLIEGVNDGEDEWRPLLPLLRGRRAVLNLIPYNRVDGVDFRRPDAERLRALVRRLHAGGVLTKLRQSAGQDVDAGCGQLRARDLADPQRVRQTAAGRTRLPPVVAAR